MTSYNAHQQVFTVSLCSNIVSPFCGTQETLQEAMEANLPGKLLQAGPDWEIAYGPVVWKNKPSNSSTHADNAWFVARCPSLLFEDGKHHETYVVSVAGTMSNFDWICEDFWVNSVVDFVQWMETGVLNAPAPTKECVAGNSYIAAGTALGVHSVLSCAAPPSAAGAGLSLYEYIQTLANPQSDSKIIFTGHSLGAALTPTIAAAVAYTGVLDWPVPNRLVYPTAGATPGNTEFARLYKSLFPLVEGEDYRVWNANITNSMDVVPHAWCADSEANFSLLRLPELYGPALPVVQHTIDRIVPAVSTYGYCPIQHRVFRGDPSFNAPENLRQWGEVASLEHVPAYMDYIGVQNLDLARTVTPAGDTFGEKLFSASKAVYKAPGEEDGIVADEV